MNNSLLVKNIDYLITLNKQSPVLKNYSILIENNLIKKVAKKIVATTDKTIDAAGMVVFPGFINTHLHSPQVFHRN